MVGGQCLCSPLSTARGSLYLHSHRTMFGPVLGLSPCRLTPSSQSLQEGRPGSYESLPQGPTGVGLWLGGVGWVNLLDRRPPPGFGSKSYRTLHLKQLCVLPMFASGPPNPQRTYYDIRGKNKPHIIIRLEA